MYFYRADRLNPPDWMQQALLDELEQNKLTPTGMNLNDGRPSLNNLLLKSQGRPELVDFIKSTYGAAQLTGWNISKELNQKISEYYSDFLRTVPDIPKITVMKITSTNNSFDLHVDDLKTASLFCVIRSDHRARTTWYEPLPTAEATVRSVGTPWKNKKLVHLFPGDFKPVTAIWADPWEMILFDNNSAHSVEEFLPGGDRVALAIGFTNISHDDLIECYRRWISNA
jgi:hypothetical protein